MIRLLLAATSVMALVALAGCAGAAAEGRPSPSAPPSASIAPSAPSEESTAVLPESSAPASSSPAPSDVAPPSASHPSRAPAEGSSALGDLPLSTEALGDIRIGRPVPATTTLVRWGDFCRSQPAEPGNSWYTPYSDSTGVAPFFLWPIDSRVRPITGIFIGSPEIRTRHGLHVGSTLAEVKALGAVHDAPAGFGDDVWVIHGSAGQLTFEFEHDRVVLIVLQREGDDPPGGFGLCD
jgi:hypothetical protein